MTDFGAGLLWGIVIGVWLVVAVLKFFLRYVDVRVEDHQKELER